MPVRSARPHPHRRVTVSTADRVCPYVPEIVTVVSDEGLCVVTLKVALTDPSAPVGPDTPRPPTLKVVYDRPNPNENSAL